jgi:hypothetical protein
MDWPTHAPFNRKTAELHPHQQHVLINPRTAMYSKGQSRVQTIAETTILVSAQGLQTATTREWWRKNGGAKRGTEFGYSTSLFCKA